MIYGASLGPFVKKALLDKAFQTNVKKICETLPTDPVVSNMDAVVLGPKDMRGFSGRALEAAVRKKHPNVGVIYFYQKDKDAELIGGDVHKVNAARVTPDGINEAINTILEVKSIGKDNRVITSGDNVTRSGQEDLSETEEPDTDADTDTDTESLADLEAAPTAETPEVEHTKSLEQKVLEMGRFADFDFLKQALEKDIVLSHLLEENTQYAGLVHMLEALDLQMSQVFRDTALTSEERFERIKQIGIDRAAYRGVERSILAEKLAAVMDAVVQSAEATVNSRIHGIREALGTVSSAQLMFEDQGKLKTLIDSRLHVQMDLMALSKEIIEVYMAMDRSVTELIETGSDPDPSEIDYINELMSPVKPVFIPRNIATVTQQLISDLQKKNVALSIVDEKIKNLIHLVFKLCEEDATIIEYQQKLIRLLMAQRVENVVVVDNVIKYCLRIFVGPEDSGRTATALTWSGVVSRRQNTLLLDLTGRSKLKQYGEEPVSLDEFMANRIERQFLSVEGNLENDLAKVNELVSELRTRLHYYAHIHILLDAGQTSLLNRLAKSALSVHWISDGTPRGTSALRKAVREFRQKNIAVKVILIDPPLDPIRMLSDLSLDPLETKIITLPRLKPIRASSLNRTKPYENKEVAEVFEEAFR